MIKRAYKILWGRRTRDHFPNTPRTMANYKPGDIDEATRILMMTGLVRDRATAQKLMRQHDESDPVRLASKIKKRRKRIYPKKRLMNWLRRIEGTTPHAYRPKFKVSRHDETRYWE